MTIDTAAMLALADETDAMGFPHDGPCDVLAKFPTPAPCTCTRRRFYALAAKVRELVAEVERLQAIETMRAQLMASPGLAGAAAREADAMRIERDAAIAERDRLIAQVRAVARTVMEPMARPVRSTIADALRAIADKGGRQ